MKMYDVIVERHNGGYRATVPTLPNLLAEGATQDEAVVNAKLAIEEFFKSAEVRTIAVDLPSGGPTLAEKWHQNAGITPQNPADPDYQEYLAELAREKLRQRQEAQRENDAEPSQKLDKRSPRIWLETAGMFAGDEEAMWQHIEEIEAERRRQREEVEREYDLLEARGNGE